MGQGGPVLEIVGFVDSSWASFLGSFVGDGSLNFGFGLMGGFVGLIFVVVVVVDLHLKLLQWSRYYFAVVLGKAKVVYRLGQQVHFFRCK